MKRIVFWGFGLIGAAAAAIVALFVATQGDYDIPALVTDDPMLPALNLGGNRLHVRVVDGPPGADTVIVLHGGPGGDFRSLLALTALSGSHRVIFYDQRGAGLSARVPDDALTLDGYLAELNAVIDHFSPNRQVSLIGHSWGAMLATAYMGQNPARIDRAVLIEPGFLDQAGRAGWLGRSRVYMSGPRYWARAVITGFRSAHVNGPDPDAGEDFLIGHMVHGFADHPDNPYHCGKGYSAPTWRFGARASAMLGKAPAAEIDRIAAGAARFQGPVLLLAGACNDWTGATLQSGHAGRFADARLTIVPGAGHDVIWDNSEAALSAIGKFMTAPPKGRLP